MTRGEWRGSSGEEKVEVECREKGSGHGSEERWRLV